MLFSTLFHLSMFFYTSRKKSKKTTYFFYISICQQLVISVRMPKMYITRKVKELGQAAILGGDGPLKQTVNFWKLNTYYYWHPGTFCLEQTVLLTEACTWPPSLCFCLSWPPLAPSIEPFLHYMASFGFQLLETCQISLDITIYHTLCLKRLKRAEIDELDHKGLEITLFMFLSCTFVL